MSHECSRLSSAYVTALCNIGYSPFIPGDSRRSLTDRKLIENERVLTCRVVISLKAAGSAAMGGRLVDTEYEWVMIGLGRPKLCHPLGRLEVLHLRVPEAGIDQHRGIVLRPHVIVGRIGEHIVVVDLV